MDNKIKNENENGHLSMSCLTDPSYAWAVIKQTGKAITHFSETSIVDP